MFSVTGKLLVKPRLLEDLEEQLHCSAFEEAALTRRICNPTSCWLPLDMELLHRQVLALQTQRVLLGMGVGRDWDAWVSPRRVAPHSRPLLTASHPCTEKRRKASAWQRNLGYPLAMLCLLILTVCIPAVGSGMGSSSPLSTLGLPREEGADARTRLLSIIVVAGSSHCGSAEMNLTRKHEVAGSISGLTQGVKDLALP
uniref:Limb development membrane protein 1 like n=1 Tax=Sus scrofa TaxID=9823 RepID=A0A8D1AXT8_PIG